MPTDGNGNGAKKKTPWYMPGGSTTKPAKSAAGKATSRVPRYEADMEKQSNSNARGDALYQWAQADLAKNAPVDQWGGATPLDLMLAGMNGSKGGGGSSHRGGGGGGGGGGGASGSGIDPAALDALQAQGMSAYGQSKAQALAAYLDSFNQGNAALDQGLAAQNKGFDDRSAQLRSLQSEGDTRLAGIVGDLNNGAAQTRQNVAGAYGAGDARLQALQAEYAKAAQGRDQAANGTLGAFGAGTVAQSGGGVNDLLYAGRAANSMQGTNADAMYAGRSNLYNGLSSDARTQSTNTYGALQGQLGVQQQQAAAQAAAAHAALAGQYAQQQQQTNLSSAQAEQDWLLQIAKQRAGL